MNNLLEEAISQLKAKGTGVTTLKQLSSGKEATVYLVTDENKKLLALKVYKDYISRSFKNNQEYLAGKHVRAHSEKRAIQKQSRFGKELTQKLWVKREFYMLKKLYDAGISTPKPIEMTKNAILMEYIGDENTPAPRLKDTSRDKKTLEKTFRTIIENIDLMYRQGIIHGDLSPFNILFWNNKPYIIDFPQSIDIRNNPNAQEMLERDRCNIDNWYKKATSTAAKS